MKRREKLFLLAGGLIAITIVLDVAGYRPVVALHNPRGVFLADTFDYAAKTYPLTNFQIQSQIGLHWETYAKLRVAFDAAGPDAANAMFWDLLNTHLIAHASDESVLACSAARAKAARELTSNPHLCREVLQPGWPVWQRDSASAQTRLVDAACDAAALSGASHYTDLKPPPPGISALSNTAAADNDAAICAAAIDLAEKTAPMPAQQAAATVRDAFAIPRAGNVVSVDPPPTEPPPPDDALHCTPAGTRITLDAVNMTGEPVVWTSLGRHGFDCAVSSSGSGNRAFFHTLDSNLRPDGTPNYLRALWPLAAGKTFNYKAALLDGTAEEVHVSVSGPQRYVLPFGTTEAYAIDRDTTDIFMRHYVTTDIFSPELGTIIGWRIKLLKGGDPQIGVDYNVTAIEPP